MAVVAGLSVASTRLLLCAFAALRQSAELPGSLVVFKFKRGSGGTSLIVGEIPRAHTGPESHPNKPTEPTRA